MWLALVEVKHPEAKHGIRIVAFGREGQVVQPQRLTDRQAGIFQSQRGVKSCQAELGLILANSRELIELIQRIQLFLHRHQSVRSILSRLGVLGPTGQSQPIKGFFEIPFEPCFVAVGGIQQSQ